MKKFITLTVLSFALLAACSPKGEDKTPTLPNQEQETPGSKANTGMQNLDYTNDEYGFILTFPETWQGYTVSERTLDWGEAGSSDSVDFGIAGQGSLFNISIHTKEQWEKITSQEGPKPSVLGENDQYVYGFATAQDTENAEAEERMKEVKDIARTFEVK